MTAPPPAVRLTAAFYRLYIRRATRAITELRTERAALIDQQQHLKGGRP
jgi:hypothetical protein